jgi:hypothetical protein
MRRLENACEVQIMAQSGGAELIMPPMKVIGRTGDATMTMDQNADALGEKADGPAMTWAAVRRWMAQIDPGYMT